MQLTTYLILILLLILEAIVLCFTATHLEFLEYKFPGSHPPSYTSPSFFILLTTMVQPTSHPLYTSHPSPHSSSLHPQNQSSSLSLYIFTFRMLSSTACKIFPQWGAPFGVTMDWCALIGVPGVESSFATWGGGGGGGGVLLMSPLSLRNAISLLHSSSYACLTSLPLEGLVLFPSSAYTMHDGHLPYAVFYPGLLGGRKFPPPQKKIAIPP